MKFRFMDSKWDRLYEKTLSELLLLEVGFSFDIESALKHLWMWFGVQHKFYWLADKTHVMFYCRIFSSLEWEIIEY